MYHYTVAQWFFFFFLYCFFGWCFESSYVSMKQKHPVNRGFMYGPFLPIYGSGVIMMLVVSAPFQDNIVATYFAGLVGATALEYVTGVVMEALFQVRYWDYSNQKFQFQGHICLSSSLAWGFFTVFMTKVIHKPIENFVLSLPITDVNILAIVIGVVAAADFAMSFKAAMDLRAILVKMEKAREEMAHLKRRLDVVIALAGEENEQRKEHFGQKMEALQKGIEETLAGLKSRNASLPEELRREVGDVESAYTDQLEKHKRIQSLKNGWVRNLMRRNPGMASEKFKQGVEEMKSFAVNRIGRKNDKS